MSRDFDRFRAYAAGKRFSLIGAGVSNLPLVPFLLRVGANQVTVRDLKISPESPEALEAKRGGADLILGEDYLEGLNEDVIIRSPGIRPDKMELVIAGKKGARVTCETELFLEFCTAKTYGVTGSDGKTTTTTLISKLLTAAGKTVLLGGNIGKSMLPQLAETEGDGVCAVMELSSFQLMNCRFSPNVAVITNLAENHLDWHRGMAEYLEAKKNILLHQNKADLAVLNGDNPYTASLTGNGQTRRFYCTGRGNDKLDASFEKDKIVLVENGKETEILAASQIRIPGRHNVENYMAAILATRDEVSKDQIISVAKTFPGVEHRMELVREKDGVKYFNSSIDSSPSRTTAALRAFSDKVILIAGGYDKHLDYTALGDVICKHTKTVLLCGATADKIENGILSSKLYREGEPMIIHCSSLEQCVKMARDGAVSGDQVVLSPASASFDQFKNFEERGKAFKSMVEAL